MALGGQNLPLGSDIPFLFPGREACSCGLRAPDARAVAQGYASRRRPWAESSLARVRCVVWILDAGGRTCYNHDPQPFAPSCPRDPQLTRVPFLWRHVGTPWDMHVRAGCLCRLVVGDIGPEGGLGYLEIGDCVEWWREDEAVGTGERAGRVGPALLGVAVCGGTRPHDPAGRERRKRLGSKRRSGKRHGGR